MLRGDGYIGADIGIAKTFAMPFNHRLRFRWDVFNVTNTVRFDTGNVTMTPDQATTFGQYTGRWRRATAARAAACRRRCAGSSSFANP